MKDKYNSAQDIFFPLHPSIKKKRGDLLLFDFLLWELELILKTQ